MIDEVVDGDSQQEKRVMIDDALATDRKSAAWRRACLWTFSRTNRIIKINI
jgi:hypothetical protein